MGCDIHLAVEVRRDGKWERALPTGGARDPSFVELAVEKGDGWYAKRSAVEFYHNRNYYVFAVLADVRNYEDFRPISQPRGLPEDVSDAVRHLANDTDDDGDIWLGDHSFSWLTLTELQAYPWDTESAGDFVERFIPELAKIGAPEDVRIVFGFDS